MKIIYMIVLCGVCAACAALRDVDAALYGQPPNALAANTTVLVEFADPVSVSMKCGTAAFGPVGALVPVHGCVQAQIGAPIRMVTAMGGPLTNAMHIIEFSDIDRAARICASDARIDIDTTGLPEAACVYAFAKGHRARIVWPNPCATGDIYMCHELAHVNQYRLGWEHASLLSPRNHWGRAPKRPTAGYMVARRNTDTAPSEVTIGSAF